MSVPNSQPFKFALWHTRECPRARPYLPRKSKGVESVATESEARARPYLPRKSKGVESVATESEAGRLLAARVPPELFDDILFYVNVDRVSQRPNWNPEGDDLKQCSLVCIFWANRCREHMFSGGTLEIKSYQDAEIFRRYVVQGSSRLTPVHQLISKIGVYQGYKSGRSFLHLLNLLIIQDKLKHLSIEGPVPDGFNHAKLDTPHWSTPPSVVVPGSFLRNDISLIDVHFPSFYHLLKYIRHFSHATSIWFNGITWDGPMALSLPHYSSTVCQRRPRCLWTVAAGICTDAVHLTLTALMMNPNCPLHRISDEERVWMIKFMTLLWSDEPNPGVYIGFNISEQATTMRASVFHFVFEEAPAPDRPASALSVVGMHAYIDGPYYLPAADNFDALVNHARTHPTIRALVLLFDSLYNLQVSVKPFIEVLALETGTVELVLVYETKEERKAVGVDLVTLEPNDCLWADLQSRYGMDKSLEILQRQLKKKRWMSLH